MQDEGIAIKGCSNIGASHMDYAQKVTFRVLLKIEKQNFQIWQNKRGNHRAHP